MFLKKILFVSLDKYLIQLTKSRYSQTKNNYVKIYDLEVDNVKNINLSVFDIIIVDSELLFQPTNHQTLLEIIYQSNHKSAIFLLEGDGEILFPSELKIQSVFSKPILPDKLWKMMDETLHIV